MWNYYGYLALRSLAPHVPEALGYRLADLLGAWSFHLATTRRWVVVGHVRRVLGPEAPEEEVRRVARGVFCTALRNYFDLFRAHCFDLHRLRQQVALRPEQTLLSALAQGRGVVLATAHLGNLDLVMQVMAAGLGPMTVLAEPLSPPRLDRLVNGLRASHGLEVVPVGRRGLRAALSALRRGGTVAIACDRDIQGTGRRVPFFGEEAYLPSGAIELARRTGAILLPVFSRRERGSFFVVDIEPPLELEDTVGEGEAEADMQRLIDILERHIRETPEQWVVFQPIWRPAASNGHQQQADLEGEAS